MSVFGCNVLCPAVQWIKKVLFGTEMWDQAGLICVLNLEKNSSKDLQLHDSSISFNNFKNTDQVFIYFGLLAAKLELAIMCCFQYLISLWYH